MSDSPPLETDCRTVAQKLRDGDRNFVLLDCREQDEYDTVHISEAILLPMSQLTTRYTELEPYKDHEIAVHCHHGGRSLQVANWLRKQGFSRAKSMTGGIDAWSSEIDPSLPRY